MELNLKGIRRRAVALEDVPIIDTSFPSPDVTYPLVISPRAEGVDLAGWGRENRAYVNSQLLKHGAILFRGFQLPAVDDFENAVSGMYENLYAGYGDLPRAGASANIYTSTPYPADKSILFHNESSHLHSWPMKISFFCVTPALKGGDTPLLDCREVCRVMSPSLLKAFAEKGLMYVRNFSEGIDVSWRRFFHTDDKAKVEAMCKQDHLDCEWTANDGLRVRHRTQAVARHPITGELAFFNQIQLHHPFCLDPDVRKSMQSLFAEEDLPRNVYFGDGSPISDEIMQEVDDLFWKHCVSGPWQKGDIVMLDNMLTSHARKPFEGPRRIVVAMGEMIDSSALVPLDHPVN